MGKNRNFYHDNGKRKIEIQYFKRSKEKRSQYFENKLDGLYTTWHENGELRSQSTYSMGKVDGLLIHWHENGQKKSEYSFKNGVITSRPKSWNDEGVLIEKIRNREKFFIS